MNNAAAFVWNSAGLTDVGRVRHVNEDAFASLPEIGLWVVADGMGGHTAGDLASRAVVDSLSTIAAHSRMSSFIDDVEDRLLLVNRRLALEAAGRSQQTTIGSTVVVLLAAGHHCACMWSGDSRAYRLRGGVLQAVSRDHSQTEEMIEQGLLSRENAESHPAANVITRAVGADKELYVDVQLEELQDGDRYLLCSDGLYKEVEEKEIASHMQKGSCEEICTELIELALERGSRDNVTVVAIEFLASQ